MDWGAYMGDDFEDDFEDDEDDEDDEAEVFVRDPKAFRRELDATLSRRDPPALRAFLIAQGEWTEETTTDPEAAMWLMIAASPAHRALHSDAETWLRTHGHAAEADAILGGRGGGGKRGGGKSQRPGGHQGGHGGPARGGGNRPQGARPSQHGGSQPRQRGPGQGRPAHPTERGPRPPRGT